jgi:hypothetical protein
LVDLDWPSLKLKGRYVLKLYDRRCAAQLRQDCKFGPYGKHPPYPWTLEIEKKYQEFAQGGEILAHLEDLAEHEEDYEWLEDAQQHWTQSQLEAYIQYCCLKFYSTEVSVYNRLQDLQGREIPKLFACVSIKLSSASYSIHKHFDCPGILLEYIDGFPLTSLQDFAPKVAWQQICENAISIVNKIGSQNVRNEDVKTRSLIIRKDSRTGDFTPLMMDFGHCVIRKPDQDDHDWRESKAHQDEEGAIGLVMERLLNGGFVYKRSVESEALVEEFMGEE